MKLIITEEQLNKLTNKVRQAIEKYGFIEASEVMGINKLKLAKMARDWAPDWASPKLQTLYVSLKIPHFKCNEISSK